MLMKIMIVDDSNLSRLILKRALGEENTIIEAEDGTQALELYTSEKPDLVILDLLMPGISGMNVLSQLIQLDPQVRVVIGSADIQNTTRQEAQRLGAVGYIKKPFHEQELKRMVTSFREGRQDAE
jgi:two-component system, chemotaxis family, chemotaxis protein CheY